MEFDIDLFAHQGSNLFDPRWDNEKSGTYLSQIAGLSGDFHPEFWTEAESRSFILMIKVSIRSVLFCDFNLLLYYGIQGGIQS
jgi:hypothetical protein